MPTQRSWQQRNPATPPSMLSYWQRWSAGKH